MTVGRSIAIVVVLAVVTAVTGSFVVDRSPGAIGSAGGLRLTGLVVTDEIRQQSGEPGPARDTFPAGSTVWVWVAFDDSEVAAGQAVLESVFLRGGERVSASSLRLPQPDDEAVFALGPSQTRTPGRYQVVLSVDGVRLASADFAIR